MNEFIGRAIRFFLLAFVGLVLSKFAELALATTAMIALPLVVLPLHRKLIPIQVLKL